MCVRVSTDDCTASLGTYVVPQSSEPTNSPCLRWEAMFGRWSFFAGEELGVPASRVLQVFNGSPAPDRGPDGLVTLFDYTP